LFYKVHYKLVRVSIWFYYGLLLAPFVAVMGIESIPLLTKALRIELNGLNCVLQS